MTDTLLKLGIVYSLEGELEAARTTHEQALKQLHGRFGDAHPETAECIRYLAFLEWLAGRPQRALELELRSLAGKEAFLSHVLSFTSEEQRLRFHETFAPHDLLATLAGEGEMRTRVAPFLARTVLRHKGLTLDSLLEDARLARGE